MNFYTILLTNIHNIVHYLGNLAYDVWYQYRQTSNVRHTLVGNKIVDLSDVVGASPVRFGATYIRDLTVGPAK